MRPARRGAAAIFAWPLAIGVLSAGGLAAGLMGEGGWDALAWLGLLPPVVLAWRAR